MPRLKTEDILVGNFKWLGSTHGIAECRTEVLDVSAFSSSVNYPDGYIPSGTPVKLSGGKLVPYTSANDGGDDGGGGTNDLDVLAGHIFTDQQVVGTDDFAVPLLDHGRVVVANVPKGGDTFAKPNAAQSADTTIVYI